MAAEQQTASSTLTLEQASRAGVEDYNTARDAAAQAVAQGKILPAQANAFLIDQLSNLMLRRIERGELAGKAN